MCTSLSPYTPSASQILVHYHSKFITSANFKIPAVSSVLYLWSDKAGDAPEQYFCLKPCCWHRLGDLLSIPWASFHLVDGGHVSVGWSGGRTQPSGAWGIPLEDQDRWGGTFTVSTFVSSFHVSDDSVSVCDVLCRS